MDCKEFLRLTRSRLILLLVGFFVGGVCLAQKHDSLYLYEKIKNVADKSKFATMIYQAVFVDPKPDEYPVSTASRQEVIVNPYLKFEGTVIRKIIIKVYDPFGHSVNDTAARKVNFLQGTGNYLHVTTRHRVIANKLLFKKNELLSALSVSESERLLRQSMYLNDARIYLVESSGHDSVDVYVIAQDKWTLAAPAMLTDVSANVRLINQNLFGTGQQFDQYVGLNRPGIMDYSGYYNVSNIDHTYISSRLAYAVNKDGANLGLSFDRPFYSPLAKWAGGIGVNKSWRYFPYVDSTDGEEKKLPLQNMGYDMWLGKSFKINSKRKLFNQSTNIIIGERYYTDVFDKRPPFTIDAQRTNLGSSSFVGNVGLSVQQFYKEKYIYRFGANEDVPHGLIIQLLYGATKKEFNEIKYYTGLEVARAMHIKEGYFSSTLSYGMFFNKFMKNDITTSFRLNYFSDLFQIGKWYFREFINYNLVFGENKAPSEKLTLTAGDLYGFNSGKLNGNSKMVLNFEAVVYAPYNLAGFRFAPVLLTGLGTIGDQHHSLLQSNLYQAYALGLLVRNENLLISTFEVSFGAYPFFPDGQNYVLKYNPVTSFTLRVRAFSISKPAFITY